MLNAFLSTLRQSFAPKRIVRLVRTPAWVLFVTGALSNVISIFTALFTLLVYDKVYPHDGFNTLVVLTIGVLALLLIDVSLKMLRTSTINQALYGNQGGFDGVTRRHEFRVFSKSFSSSSLPNYLQRSIQDLSLLKPSDVKAATLIVDLPFVLLLLLAIYFIAGPLVWVPIVAGLFLLVFIGWSHAKNTEATKALEKSKQKAIESYAFISRGSEWLFGLGAWHWLGQKEADVKSDIAKSSAQVAMLSSGRQTIYQAVIQLVSISTVFFGFFLYQSGEIGFGGIIATYLLANKALSPIGTIVQMGAIEDKDDQALENTQPEATQISLSGASSDWTIKLKDLDFTYEGKANAALKIPSLRIGQGEKIAVLGRSGSGKTTFAKLLTQMLAGYEGTFTFNDVPVESVRAEDWMKQCVYVPQTPWLGQGALFDQIRLGDTSITDDDIAQAIVLAGLNEVLTLDQKSISSDGLSAGQLQALGLIRCLVRKAPLLILDEPTNFLDEETEKKLMQAIFKQYADATILLITHRKSLLALMQRALVFENGLLVKDGQIKRVDK